MNDTPKETETVTRCYVPIELLEQLDKFAPKYIKGARNMSARARWAIEEYLEMVAADT